MKLEEFLKKKTMLKLTQAYHFAAQKHTAQRRKNTAASPYINHPIEVVNLLAEGRVENEVVLCAGVLHDTVEDTETTYEELVEKFGKEIADVVMECSDNKKLLKVQRKQFQIENASHKSREAQLVKLADKLSNLSDLHRDPPKNWSSEEIYGYFVWAYVVCREMKGVNDYLESELWKIFDEVGVSKLTEANLKIELEKYYQKIYQSD